MVSLLDMAGLSLIRCHGPFVQLRCAPLPGCLECYVTHGNVERRHAVDCNLLLAYYGCCPYYDSQGSLCAGRTMQSRALHSCCNKDGCNGEGGRKHRSKACVLVIPGAPRVIHKGSLPIGSEPQTPSLTLEP